MTDINDLLRALKPFADVANYDISSSESDEDLFRNAAVEYSKAPRITVRHFRAALSALTAWNSLPSEGEREAVARFLCAELSKRQGDASCVRSDHIHEPCSLNNCSRMQIADAILARLRSPAPEWRPISEAPAPDGCIDNYPSFFAVDEATVVRYAYDEGEALCLVRARLIETNELGFQWEPYAFAPIPAPPSASTQEGAE